MCPNLSPISPKLILYIGTKVEDTMKLNIHWKATAMATAAPRMVFGKISAISTQQMAPAEHERSTVDHDADNSNMEEALPQRCKELLRKHL